MTSPTVLAGSIVPAATARAVSSSIAARLRVAVASPGLLTRRARNRFA
jgi:hypothetical protein